MRILLVQTLSVEGITQERVYPIGLATLAGGLLDDGHDVRIFDMNMVADPFGALRADLVAFLPEVVGLSLRNIDPLANKTSSLIPPFLVAVDMVASLAPTAWLIAGGTGFSLFPERIMVEAPAIHYGIAGEAEASLPRLIDALDDPPPLPGLYRRSGGIIRQEQPSSPLAMDMYRSPRWDILDPSVYAGINSYVPSIGIETKRGCPFHCAYCVYPKLQGSHLRCRSPRSVVDEMEQLHKEYGIERFHFTDPIVNYPEVHLDEICEDIVRRRLKIKWDGFMREDHFNERNAALYERAGCECFSFSPDGLSQHSLDTLDKRLNIQDILRAAALAAETDIMSVYHFMVNVPGETEKTCEQGLRLIEKIYDIHEKKRNIGTVVLNNIRILPGTSIERTARSTGVIGPGTDLLYPTYFNPQPFEAFRYRLEALHLGRNVFMWQGIK